MNATVTNSHHFCSGIKLTIQNDKLNWELENLGALDPKNSLDDFIKSVKIAFEFLDFYI
jgi:hypothetical protein